jgi:uridine kinase
MRRKKSKIADTAQDIDDEVLRTYLEKYDFDVPEAIDWELMEKGLDLLANHKPFECPIYDFDTKSRKVETEKIMPNDCIIIEGTLIFFMEKIRKLMDLKIYIETDNDVRLSRRVKQEQSKFNKEYTLQDCLKRYTQFVKPATEKYVEPSKIYTDVIIPNYKFDMQGNEESKHMLVNLIINRCNAGTAKKEIDSFKL